MGEIELFLTLSTKPMDLSVLTYLTFGKKQVKYKRDGGINKYAI